MSDFVTDTVKEICDRHMEELEVIHMSDTARDLMHLHLELVAIEAIGAAGRYHSAGLDEARERINATS